MAGEQDPSKNESITPVCERVGLGRRCVRRFCERIRPQQSSETDLRRLLGSFQRVGQLKDRDQEGSMAGEGEEDLGGRDIRGADQILGQLLRGEGRKGKVAGKSNSTIAHQLSSRFVTVSTAPAAGSISILA